MKANNTSWGSKRSFSEQVQPWSASPIVRNSVHVCLYDLHGRHAVAQFSIFVWPSNVVLQVWISVFTAANFLLSVKVMFFAGFCEGVKLRTACRVLGFSLADGWYVGSTGNRFGTSQTGYTVGACEATEKTMWSGKRILQVVAL